MLRETDDLLAQEAIRQSLALLKGTKMKTIRGSSCKIKECFDIIFSLQCVKKYFNERTMFQILLLTGTNFRTESLTTYTGYGKDICSMATVGMNINLPRSED